MQDSSPPILTVIICTYNRADILGECLQSLFVQTRPAADFQILVVDNNSNDGTADLVHRLAANRDNLRLVREPSQGLSHARNRGLQESNSEWVAYLDDDAKANSNWVARIFMITETTNFDAFGGPYLPWYRDGRVDWYRDEYGTNLTWMPYKEVSELASGCFSGGNAIYRRNAALTAGGFPTSFGMRGDALGYGEENILQHSLRKSGYRLGFDPHLIIHHLVPMKKQTLDWFRRRKIIEGREYVRLHGISRSTRTILSHAMAFAWIDLRNIGKAMWRFASRDYRLENVYIAVVPTMLFQREVLRQLLFSGKSEP